MKKAIFDLDDVLAPCAPGMVELLNRKTGLSVTLSDITDYDLTKFWPVTFSEITQLLIEAQHLEAMRPYPEALPTLRSLKLSGYEIHVVTSRGWHPEGKEITEDWLTAHRMPVDVVHVVSGDKEGALRAIGPAECYVDDHPRHVNTAVRVGSVRFPFLMQAPWNEHTPHTLTIRRLSQVLWTLATQ